jgi:hypothetical protein
MTSGRSETIASGGRVRDRSTLKNGCRFRNIKSCRDGDLSRLKTHDFVQVALNPSVLGNTLREAATFRDDLAFASTRIVPT